MITQKHLIALDCLRQFADQRLNLFQDFLRENAREAEAYQTAQDQVRLVEELHLLLSKKYPSPKMQELLERIGEKSC